jgi:hypothetical protein
MRTRERSGSKPDKDTRLEMDSTFYRYGEEVNTVSDDGTGLYTPYDYSQTTNDVVIPDFKRRVAAGELFNNPYNTLREETEIHPLQLTGEGHWSIDLAVPHVEYVKDVITGGSTIDPLSCQPFATPIGGAYSFPELSSEQLQAVTGAFAQMNNPSFLAGVTLAEGRKTVKYLYDLYKSLRRADQLIRKGILIQDILRKLTDPRKVERASNQYLQVRYALRPLVYEVLGLIEAIRESDRPTRSRFKYFLKDSDVVQAYDSGEYIFPTSWNVMRHFKFGWRLDKTTFYSVSGGVLAEVLLDTYSWAQRLGLHSPVQSGWELVPFSFVVDWFCNTAKLAASFDPKLNVRTRTWWCVVRQKTVFHAYPYPRWAITNEDNLTEFATPHASHGLFLGGGEITRSLTKTERFPEPARQILPLVDLRLNLGKVTDLLALAVGGFDRHRRVVMSTARY